MSEIDNSSWPTSFGSYSRYCYKHYCWVMLLHRSGLFDSKDNEMIHIFLRVKRCNLNISLQLVFNR